MGERVGAGDSQLVETRQAGVGLTGLRALLVGRRPRSPERLASPPLSGTEAPVNQQSAASPHRLHFIRWRFTGPERGARLVVKLRFEAVVACSVRLSAMAFLWRRSR